MRTREELTTHREETEPTAAPDSLSPTWETESRSMEDKKGTYYNLCHLGVGRSPTQHQCGEQRSCQTQCQHPAGGNPWSSCQWWAVGILTTAPGWTGRRCQGLSCSPPPLLPAPHRASTPPAQTCNTTIPITLNQDFLPPLIPILSNSLMEELISTFNHSLLSLELPNCFSISKFLWIDSI